MTALRVEQWPISRLVGYPGNPRKNDDAVDRMCEAIKEFGFRIPICARSTDGLIVDGHLRHKAALKMGLATVPVALADDLTEVQIKAFRLLANASSSWAEWDVPLLQTELETLEAVGYPLLLTGFDNAELVSYMAGVGTSGDPEATPEPPAVPVSRTGDLWLLGKHRLLCGDCTVVDDLVKVLRGELVDCVFTSPPYAIGIDYGEYHDTIENLRDMLPKLANLWTNAVISGGFAVINFGDIVSGQKVAETAEPCEYPMAIEYWPVFRAAGWLLWTRRIWQKPHARTHSPWAIQSCRAASDWEHLWVWKRPGRPITLRGDCSAFGIWDTSREHGVDVGKEVHGAGMAVALAMRALETHSRHGHQVLEPFSGTGTTVIAAEMTSRACNAIEINPVYVDVAVQRWQSYAQKVALLENTGQAFDEVADERSIKALAAE